MAQALLAPTVNPVASASATFAPWSCCAQPPGAVAHPDQLPAPGADWLPATVPGTVAGALRQNGQSAVTERLDLDAQDWWFRTTFDAPDRGPGDPCHLRCDGLATLAEVWLNGRLLLTTDNMFRAYRVDVSAFLEPCNELVLGFRALAEDLKKKRPRPRWKTNLVKHQQQRWHRTSLLGRIPGWSPVAPVVGPWRSVHLDAPPITVSDIHLVSRVEDDAGVVTLQARVPAGAPLASALLQVGDHEAAVAIQEDQGGWLLRGVLRLPNPPLWWPHTHGAQPLLDCALHLQAGDDRFTRSCGKVGFRHLQVSRDNFSIQVNGEAVYCRGACWTASDLLTPEGAETLAQDLRLARDAGLNMVRVGGAALYEQDAFYQLCDELGILVWQDFMFANMDYPVDDPEFAANIEAEASYQLSRLAPHPCVAVLCGNSEVEQQAAMRGVPREFWSNHWFATRLPELCAEYCPTAAYVPSTPSGGPLPFHVGHGVAHYYGVGAYQRLPREVRGADVKFAAECLAFANVPGPETLSAIMAGSPPAVHDPRWKARVPRDTGAGWDFDDVRDFYLQHFFGVDPVKMRCFDMPRYLELSRVVTGEMMAQVFAEWRSGHSRSGGGLVWFFKDLWPAAGWGIVDSAGLPKAAYYYLRRSWLPRQIALTDEGLDGLHLHVINETAELLDGAVEFLLLKDGHVTIARGETPCRLAPRSRQTIAADALLDGFFDVTYSYRFGPPQHDVAIATLLDERRQVLSEAVYFVRPREPSYLSGVQLDAQATPGADGQCEVALQCDHFLQSVSLDAKGFLPEDNFFHLPPSRRKVVRFRPVKEAGARFRATLEALNLKHPVEIRLKAPPV